MVTKQKDVIVPNDIITFNEQLEFLSSLILELVNIYESSHEEAIKIFKANKDLNTKKNYVTGDVYGNYFELSY